MAKRKAPQKARKQHQEARQRVSQTQAERSPMLGVRVPRELYTQLRERAAFDGRTLADWLRRHLPRLLDIAAVPDIIENGRMVLKGFDEGIFVRNIDHDNLSGWSIRSMPYIGALACLQRGLNADAQEPTERGENQK